MLRPTEAELYFDGDREMASVPMLYVSDEILRASEVSEWNFQFNTGLDWGIASGRRSLT